MAKDTAKGTSTRGFASMSQKRRQEISSQGGKAVPPNKRSFFLDRSLASEAGRKGGMSVPPEQRSFAQDPELASRAGKKGSDALRQNKDK